MTRKKSAYTLTDVLVATVIVATSISAAMAFMTAGTSANGQTAKLTQAITLANNIHELAMRMPIRDDYNGSSYPFAKPNGATPGVGNNILWLNGHTFDPPVDSLGIQLTDGAQSLFPGWTQQCTVSVFDIADPTQSPPPAPSNTNARQLRVTVTKDGDPIYTATRIFAPTVEP